MIFLNNINVNKSYVTLAYCVYVFKCLKALDDRPRELSDLVRVIPQGSAKKYAVNGRGPERIRSENYDPEQQQRYREGLATDKRILDKSPAVKRELN